MTNIKDLKEKRAKIKAELNREAATFSGPYRASLLAMLAWVEADLRAHNYHPTFDRHGREIYVSIPTD